MSAAPLCFPNNSLYKAFTSAGAIPGLFYYRGAFAITSLRIRFILRVTMAAIVAIFRSALTAMSSQKLISPHIYKDDMKYACGRELYHDILIGLNVDRVHTPTFQTVTIENSDYINFAQPLDGRETPTKQIKFSTTLPSDWSSNASTCGSSDEEELLPQIKADQGDTVVVALEPVVKEDIGDIEMKLMLERGQQIKNLKKSKNRKQSKRVKQTNKSTEQVKPSSNLNAPLRIKNTTNTLWNWSVYGGFHIDIHPALLDVSDDTGYCHKSLSNEAVFEAFALDVLHF